MRHATTGREIQSDVLCRRRREMAKVEEASDGERTGHLPPFFPADTVELTRWEDVIEGLRSVHLHQESPSRC
jgi:hypothetical protein